jgi:hypothetical protein
MWVGTERRSDLKEEASDLKQSRERGREIGTKWNYHYLELEQPTLDNHTSLVFIPPS